MKKNYTAILFTFLVFALSVRFILIPAIRRDQLAPHWVTVKFNGVIWSRILTTNNIYISHTRELRLGSNGLEYVQVPYTNEYWHIWKCFKK